MRWCAMIVVLTLLASVPCLAACTTAACDEIAKQSERAHLPPCHQKQSKESSPQNPSEHTGASIAPDLLLQLEIAADVATTPVLQVLSIPPVTYSPVVESGADFIPSLAACLVLRI